MNKRQKKKKLKLKIQKQKNFEEFRAFVNRAAIETGYADALVAEIMRPTKLENFILAASKRER